jgi:hypothetical protein
MPGVYISGYEDIQWALRHPEVFSSSADALSIGQEQPLIPLQVDPPLHTSYRRLLNPPFTPKRIGELESERSFGQDPRSGSACTWSAPNICLCSTMHRPILPAW